MKKTYLPVFVVIALLAVTTNVLGQGPGKESKKKLPQYDEWPTVESNAGLNRPGGVSPDFVLMGRQWNKRIITYFFQNGTPDIAGDNEENAVRAALNIWSGAVPLFFVEVCNQANADISFQFGAGNHGDPSPDCEPGLGAFDGQNGTLAHNMGGPDPGNNCGTQGADVHFDEDENWIDAVQANGNQPIDLVTVAAHELGHALGLFHTTVSGSLMLGSYSGSRRTLGADDLAGIRNLYLYNSPPVTDAITGPSLVCVSGGSFTLNNVPVGATVTWQAAPANLFVTSSGTASNVTLVAANAASGSGTLTFTISTGCGVPVQISSAFWVGNPATPVIAGPSTLCPGDCGDFGVANFPGNGATSFTWQYPYLTCYTACNTNVSAIGLCAPQGFGQIYVQGQNACGTSSYGFRWISSCSGYYSAYPNPANDYIEVSPMAEVQTFESESGNSSETVDKQAAIQVKLLEESGNIVLEQKLTRTGGRLNISNIPAGRYVLHINNGTDTDIRHITIE